MMTRLLSYALVLLLSIAASGGSASAQLLPGNSTTTAPSAEAVQIPPDLKEDEIDSLIAPLDDREARELLREALQQNVQQLEADTLASGEQMSGFTAFLERLREGSSDFSDNFSAIVNDLPQIGPAASHAFVLLTDLQGWPRFALGVMNLAAMLVAGFLAATLVQRLFVGVEQKFSTFKATTFRQKLSALLLRGGFKLSELAAFFVTGQIVSLMYFDRFDPMRLFLLAWFSTVCVYLFMRILARLLFAPSTANLRLVRLSDTSANWYANTLIWFVTIGAFAEFNGAMFRLLGVPETLIAVWNLACGTLSFAAIALLLFALNRTQPVSKTRATAEHGSADPIHRNSLSQFVSENLGRQRLLLSLVALAALYSLWFRAIITAHTHDAAAVILVVSAIALAQFVRSIDTRDESVQDPNLAPVSHSALSFCAALFWIIAAIGLVQALGLDLVQLAQTPAGREAVAVLLKVTLILLIAAVLWILLAGVIQRYIRREQAKATADLGDVEMDDGGSGVVVSRLGTLLPIFRGFAFALLAVITLMFVLSSIGIDIGPLLAGAGVVGIAIGFGAQTLVKDIFSGIFFLIDDAFRIGEYVEFEDYKGEVEKISIRSMQLRHHRGPVHTVPFGELRAITNHNRDWVIYKQDFELPYETDIEKVRKIVKKIGQELLTDPDHGPSFLAPLKSQGVKRVEGGVLVIGTKFTCKPREQWLLRRVVYQRVRDKLYENGIELAHRRVQVQLPDQFASEVSPDSLASNSPDEVAKSEKLTAIAAAAGAAVQDEENKSAGPAKGKKQIR